MMLKLFQVCFITGTLYTVISFVLGHLLDFAGVDGDIDTDADIGLDGDVSGVAVSPLKPITIASFVTVFGGVGMIFIKNGHGVLIALAAAMGIGFAVAFAIYRFIVVPLYKAQNTSAVSQKELIGCLAYAALNMKGETFGKIRYTVEGNTYSAPAKSIDGASIPTGAPVVVININKNVFYVKQVKGGNV